MKTEETNKLIAEFMGWESFNQFSMIAPKSEGDCWAFEDMKFHSDWNWLMEVVEKIESLDIYYNEYIDYNSSMFASGKIELSTKIEAVYNACVEFIKWYNKQTAEKK